MKKNKILKLLNKLNGTNPKIMEGFQSFDEGVANLKKSLEQNIRISTVEEVETTLNKFRKSIDFKPLLESIKQIEVGIDTKDTLLRSEIQAKLEELNAELSEARGKNKDSVNDLSEQISSLEKQIVEVSNKKLPDFPDFTTPIKQAEIRLMESISSVEKKTDKTEIENKLTKSIEDFTKEIKELRIDLLNRINSRGGGNMNRNIAIGGNTSVLSMYTDINLKAGNNVTITYARNNTTKYTDVTISATGGGSSVSGVIRSINTISTTTNAGDTAGTDYVYLCSEGVQVVLPTPTGNTNLYTIKNVSNSSILVVGTIDDDINGIIMPIKYTSVDLISNDTDWKIT